MGTWEHITRRTALREMMQEGINQRPKKTDHVAERHFKKFNYNLIRKFILNAINTHMLIIKLNKQHMKGG